MWLWNILTMVFVWTGLHLGLQQGDTIYGEFLASEIVFVEGKGGDWGFADQAASQDSWGKGVLCQVPVRKLFFILFTTELEFQVTGAHD